MMKVERRRLEDMGGEGGGRGVDDAARVLAEAAKNTVGREGLSASAKARLRATTRKRRSLGGVVAQRAGSSGSAGLG